MSMRFGLILPLSLVSCYSLAQKKSAEPVSPPTVDSTAFYNNTKKPVIASSTVDYAPTIQADGRAIIFQKSNEKGEYNLYESNLKDGVWTEPTLFDKNSKGDTTRDLIAGPSISFDGNTLYYFRSLGKNGDHDIFYRTRTKDGWSESINIGDPINSQPRQNKDKEWVGGYEGFPSITADAKTLYFIRINEDGARDKDVRKLNSFCTSIYKSDKSADGKWGKPEKLPWPINQDCEKAPRIMADGKTLIFSSNRVHINKEGKEVYDYDMYQSKMNVLGEWSMPEPLNFVNTPIDDQLPCISAEGDLMYYTYDNKDIYSVVIPPKFRQFVNNIVQGYVTDEDTQNGIGVKIKVTDALTSEKVMEMDNSASDGRYTLVLPVGRSFNVEFVKDGYSSFLYAFDLRAVKRYQEKTLDVKLFKTVKLNLNINDNEIYEPLPARITIRKRGENDFIYDTKNNPKDGRFVAELAIGSEYDVQITAPHFKSYSFVFSSAGLLIYRNFEKYVELVPEKVQVMVNVADMFNNSKVKAKVLLKNKDRDEVIEVDGNQMVSLRSGDRYEMEVTSDQGYSFGSGTIDASQGKIDPINVKLQKLAQNEKLTLHDINFESNSAKLSDESFTELNRVLELMKQYPTMKVEVDAHTDDIGPDAYNLLLSNQRAKSVADFLLENKINPERFKSKGFGKTQYKVPNDSDENRAINRRVELKILSI